MDKEKPKNNVEAEFTEIDSKNAWPLLYQVSSHISQKFNVSVFQVQGQRNTSYLFHFISFHNSYNIFIVN